MRKLALSDEILMKVDKPARYIGNEFNSVMKDTSQVNIRFAMCFPDVYEIGMSHLGIQILYDMFNRMDDVWCERVYSPWPDLHEIMKQENITVSDDRVDEEFKKIADQYKMKFDDLMKTVTDSQKESIKRELSIQETVDMLVAEANLVKAEKKAAKDEAEEGTESTESAE